MNQEAHNSSKHSQLALSWHVVFLVKTRAIVRQICASNIPALLALPLALTIYVAVSKTYSNSDSKQQEIQELELPLLLALYSPFTRLFDRCSSDVIAFSSAE
jgi:hypothetical protein